MKRLRKKYAILAATGLLAGVVATMAVSAEQYRELGTVADGVYLLEGHEGKFRVEAQDPITVLVYDAEGEPIVARSLGAGSARTFVLNDGIAVIGVFGGDAAIESQDEASIQELELVTRTFPVMVGDGGPVDEYVTAQIPPFLMGVGGRVEGNAVDFHFIAETEKGILFEATDTSFQTVPEADALEALTSRVVDLHVSATSLDGTIYLSLSQPLLPQLDEHEIRMERLQKHTHDVDAEAEEIEELVPIIPFEELDYTPVAFTLDEPTVLSFAVIEGHVLDASIYDEDGLTAAFVHLGPELSELRGPRCSFYDCWYDYETYEEIEDELVEVELDEGEYVLFTRAAHAEGFLEIHTDDVEDLFEDLQFLDTDHVALRGSGEETFDGPILDVFGYDMGDVERSVSISLDGATFFEYRSTASLFGWEYDASQTYDPSFLGAGLVTIEVDGVVGATPLWGSGWESVFVVIDWDADEDEDKDKDDH